MFAKELRERLEAYREELPVVGFNSSNYDLNVIKPYLFQLVTKLTVQTDMGKKNVMMRERLGERMEKGKWRGRGKETKTG